MDIMAVRVEGMESMPKSKSLVERERETNLERDVERIDAYSGRFQSYKATATVCLYVW